MSHGPPAKKRPNDEEDDTSTDSLPIPPDGGWGWAVVFASFAIHIVADGMTYSFGLFYVEFLEFFKEGKGYTAWIASILVGVTLCSGPISSSFVNRYGCRPVTIVGAILAGTCLALSVFAKNVFTLFITIGLGGGFGFGLIYLPAIVSVTMYFEKLRSLATGIAVCGSGFGTFIFAPLTEVLIHNYGWQTSLLVIAGIVYCCVFFGALFRPLEKVKKNETVLELTEKRVSNGGNLSANNTLNRREHNSNNTISIIPMVVVPMQRSHSYGHGMGQQNGNKNINNNNNHINNGNQKLKPTDQAARLALSQPLLTGDHHEQRHHHFKGSGTMYRPDALYTGSLHNIATVRSKTDLTTDTDKYGSIRRSDAGQLANQDAEQKMCGCIPCSKETKDTFSEMMNFSLLKEPIFIVFTVSNFLTSIGFNVPYVYIAAQAEVLGIEKNLASYLLAIIGIANTVGRIILGYLSDKPWVNRLWVYNVCLTTCGIATALSIFCLDFISLSVYSAVFGFTIGAYVGLTSVILVDLLGLERLTNAFGLLLLFQGIASFLGPPLAGFLFDIFDSYKPGFLLAGITIALSGVMLFGIPALQRHLERKQRKIYNHGEDHKMIPL